MSDKQDKPQEKPAQDIKPPPSRPPADWTGVKGETPKPTRKATR